MLEIFTTIMFDLKSKKIYIFALDNILLYQVRYKHSTNVYRQPRKLMICCNNEKRHDLSFKCYFRFISVRTIGWLLINDW